MAAGIESSKLQDHRQHSFDTVSRAMIGQ